MTGLALDTIEEKKRCAANSPPETHSAQSVESASPLVKSMGEWAHNHREFFTSVTGATIFRNALRTLVGILPTAACFTPTRYLFKWYEDKKFPDTGLHGNIIKPIMKNMCVQHTMFIFGGFTAFRAFCKLWQRNYDRIFTNCHDASKAIDAIQHLPGNSWRDLKDILPSETIATGLAAFPLAAVKLGFKHPEKSFEGNMAQARRGFVNEWAASVPAYAAFFETTDRIYDDLTGGKDNEEYYRKLCNRKPGPDHKNGNLAFFTEDKLGRLLFRRGGSLLLGLAPYVGMQRYTRAKFGDVTPGINSFPNNFRKEFVNYATFAGYTVTSDLYTRAYDALFDQLETHYGNGANRN